MASFFLSRIDVLVDPLLEKMTDRKGDKAKTAGALRGLVAIASAKVAYSLYKKIFGGGRFQALAAKGAVPQRVLWASTSSKNPAFSPVKYIEALIGPATINTMPPETINAYRSEGDPASRLEEGIDDHRQCFNDWPMSASILTKSRSSWRTRALKNSTNPSIVFWQLWRKNVLPF